MANRRSIRSVAEETSADVTPRPRDPPPAPGPETAAAPAGDARAEDLHAAPQEEAEEDEGVLELRARGLALVDKVEAARARLVETHGAGQIDAEAIHDLRVAMRRLRSCLGPLGPAWGKRRLRALADALRDVAAVTGDLRDEEVLRETLGELEIARDTRAALTRWQVGRARREAGMRGRVVSSLARSRELRRTLKRIRSRLASRSRWDSAAEDLAFASLVASAARVQERGRDLVITDKAAVHKLRIAIKRLRYNAELVTGLCALDASTIRRVSADLQEELGHLHDLEEARLRMGRALGLEKPARLAVVAALEAARDRARRRAPRKVREGLALLERALST